MVLVVNGNYFEDRVVRIVHSYRLCTVHLSVVHRTNPLYSEVNLVCYVHFTYILSRLDC